jgi:hypothetical protein
LSPSSAMDAPSIDERLDAVITVPPEVVVAPSVMW